MVSDMDSGVEARSELVVGEKRAVELDDGDGSPAKRIKSGGEQRGLVVGNVKKVAEMVLVLAAMGKMRGGKGHSDVEKELMVDARNRLVKVCEGFAPKEVFPRDAFGGVIEDLGLNKLKEQRLGFRPPKMSIAEKLLGSKRKMEEAENFSLPSTPRSTRLQGNSGTVVDSRSTSHPVRISQPDKPGRMSITSGSSQPPSPLVHSSTANSISSPYQLPSSEIRPVVSHAFPVSHLNSATLPRNDRIHLRSDGRLNGYSQPPQVQANHSNSTLRTPTWSMQPQVLSSKSGSDNKVVVNMALKVEGAAGINSGSASQTTSRNIVSQTIGRPPSQGTNNVQSTPLGNTHSEICKIVQKLLQPKGMDRPIWNPPSRDYMNKALTCQICMSTVTEIDTLLICDACEKGYHLKCLQSTKNHKVVPRGEWHCGKCLASSNGKPLPPKYGRVMRNVNTQKVSSISSTVPTTSSKIVGAPDEKFSRSKVVVANGNTTVERTPEVGGNNNIQVSGSEVKDATVMQVNDTALSMSKMDFDNKVSGPCPNNLMKTSSSAVVSSGDSLVNIKNVEKIIELKPNPTASVVILLNTPDQSQASGKDFEAISLKQSQENHLPVMAPKDPHGDEASCNANQLHEDPSRIAAIAGPVNQGRSSSGSLYTVDWIGDPIQILDEKTYFPSCCINGHIYKSMEHVLIRFDNGELIPSKLQAMWEDKNTSTKWVAVYQYYFPSDLPKAVGRPCGLESNEVYESTHSRAMMAGLIEGPCLVFPPGRYAEENDRRAHSKKNSNDYLPPLFVCKWIYDGVKGLFRDNSC